MTPCSNISIDNGRACDNNAIQAFPQEKIDTKPVLNVNNFVLHTPPTIYLTMISYHCETKHDKTVNSKLCD